MSKKQKFVGETVTTGAYNLLCANTSIWNAIHSLEHAAGLCPGPHDLYDIIDQLQDLSSKLSNQVKVSYRDE